MVFSESMDQSSRCIPSVESSSSEHAEANNVDTAKAVFTENTYTCLSKEKIEANGEKYKSMPDSQWMALSARLGGVPQKIDGSEEEKNAVRKIIQKMDIYFTEEVVGNNVYRDASKYGQCQNHHGLCAFWTSVGECETNRGFMIQKCAAACRLCLLLHLESFRVNVNNN